MDPAPHPEPPRTGAPISAAGEVPPARPEVLEIAEMEPQGGGAYAEWVCDRAERRR